MIKYKQVIRPKAWKADDCLKVNFCNNLQHGNHVTNAKTQVIILPKTFRYCKLYGMGIEWFSSIVMILNSE